MDYDSAVNLLDNPRTWKQAARALVKLGDRRALLALARAYEMRVEASRQALLDALERLGAGDQAARLYEEAEDGEQRRLAVHLMELFPGGNHLPALERAAASGDPALERQAARSLVCQPQSAAWEQVMRALLSSPDERVRAWAAEGLRLAGKR